MRCSSGKLAECSTAGLHFESYLSQGVLTLPTNPPAAQNTAIANEMAEANDAAQPEEAAAAQNNAAGVSTPRRIKMDLYAPHV